MRLPPAALSCYSGPSSLSDSSYCSANLRFSCPMHHGQSNLCMRAPAPFLPFLLVLVVYKRLQVQHIAKLVTMAARPLNHAIVRATEPALVTIDGRSFFAHAKPIVPSEPVIGNAASAAGLDEASAAIFVQ